MITQGPLPDDKRDASDDASLASIAPRWDITQYHQILSGPSDKMVIPSDPERWSILWFTNGSICVASLSEPPAGTAQYGIPVGQTTGVSSLNYRDHGGLVQQSWLIKSSAAGINVHVITVAWRVK